MARGVNTLNFQASQSNHSAIVYHLCREGPASPVPATLISHHVPCQLLRRKPLLLEHLLHDEHTVPISQVGHVIVVDPPHVNWTVPIRELSGQTGVVGVEMAQK